MGDTIINITNSSDSKTKSAGKSKTKFKRKRKRVPSKETLIIVQQARKWLVMITVKQERR